MKKIIIIFMILFLMTGCSPNENKDELNVLNWSSYIPDSVVRDFEKETGIEVNYGTYSSNEELLAKVSSSKEGTYDLVFPSDYMVEVMINRDMLKKLRLTRLDNLENINPTYLNPIYDVNNEYSVPFLAANTVIAVNRENIKDEITSYNDLLNSKYKNDIVLIDDQRIIIGMALLAQGYNMNETSELRLGNAKNWLMSLKPNIKAFDSDSPKTFLISGEVNIGVLWNAEAAIAMKENNNIEVIFPEEGIAKSIDNFVIMKGAKNEDNAYRFIDYILRPEVMKKIIEEYPYKNVNSRADDILSPDYLSSVAANTPDTLMEKAHYVTNIGDAVRLYDKVWAEIK